MVKLDDEKFKYILKILKKADVAINTLERANGNKIVFMETKKEIQELVEGLESRHMSKLTENG